MASYPSHMGERQAKRQEIHKRVMAAASLEARRVDRSVKCGEWGHHAGDAKYDGCRNDGSGCICECHDPKPRGDS